MSLTSPHAIPSLEHINKGTERHGVYLQGVYSASEPPSFLKHLSLCLPLIFPITVEPYFLVLSSWELGDWKLEHSYQRTLQTSFCEVE